MSAVAEHHAVSIQPCLAEGLTSLLSLAREFASYQPLPLPFQENRFLSLWETLIGNDAGVIYVLYVDREPQGFIGGFKYEEPYTGTKLAQENYWFVRPGYRGNGMGLYWAFEKWAKEQGCHQIRMAHLVNSMPERMKFVYEQRLGFREMETHFSKDL